MLTFEIYKDEAGEWRWTLIHRNGNVIADSGEGYKRRIDCKNAVGTMRHNVFFAGEKVKK